MNKKEVLELKRRLKKEECTFTRMSGCYVDGQKNIVLKIGETFLNLKDEEFYKYLEIAKKTLSGTIDNNLLTLEFPLSEENAGGKQQFLMGLRDSKLKNEDLLERFYQLVIENYHYVGNYLILLFHDVYDVITKTTDNAKLDESEEVYEYLLCAICPVELSKPGLGYHEDEHRIGARIRDWVVSAPVNGFLFPTFTERSCDIHSIMYYTKNAKEPRPEFMESGLGCTSKRTALEQKEVFQNILKKAIGEEEKSEPVIMKIQETLHNKIQEEETDQEENHEPILLTCDTIQDLMEESGIPIEITSRIEQSYSKEFGDTPPVAEYLIDHKVLAASAQKRREYELNEQVQMLTEQLKEKDTVNELSSSYDVVLTVAPRKVDQIKSQVIDGKKCLVIPMEEDEHATVNGITSI